MCVVYLLRLHWLSGLSHADPIVVRWGPRTGSLRHTSYSFTMGDAKEVPKVLLMIVCDDHCYYCYIAVSRDRTIGIKRLGRYLNI